MKFSCVVLMTLLLIAVVSCTREEDNRAEFAEKVRKEAASMGIYLPKQGQLISRWRIKGMVMGAMMKIGYPQMKEIVAAIKSIVKDVKNSGAFD